jgi:hypothetical protein
VVGKEKCPETSFLSARPRLALRARVTAHADTESAEVDEPSVLRADDPAVGYPEQAGV